MKKPDEAYLLEIIASISSGDLDAAEKKLRHWGKVNNVVIDDNTPCDDYNIQEQQSFVVNCYNAIDGLIYKYKEHCLDYTINRAISSLKTIKAYQNEKMEKIA